MPGENLTAPDSGRYEVTLSGKPGIGLDYGFFVPTNLTATLPVRKYPLMYPTRQEVGRWAGRYNASAKAYFRPEIAAHMASTPVSIRQPAGHA